MHVFKRSTGAQKCFYFWSPGSALRNHWPCPTVSLYSSGKWCHRIGKLERKTCLGEVSLLLLCLYPQERLSALQPESSFWAACDHVVLHGKVFCGPHCTYNQSQTSSQTCGAQRGQDPQPGCSLWRECSSARSSGFFVTFSVSSNGPSTGLPSLAICARGIGAQPHSLPSRLADWMCSQHVPPSASSCLFNWFFFIIWVHSPQGKLQEDQDLPLSLASTT